jgi:Alpha-L-fucosidase C-terminal domain
LSSRSWRAQAFGVFEGAYRRVGSCIAVRFKFACLLGRAAARGGIDRRGSQIRSTEQSSKDNRQVYAIKKGWPGSSFVLQSVSAVNGAFVYMRGIDQPLRWRQSGDGLTIEIPKKSLNTNRVTRRTGAPRTVTAASIKPLSAQALHVIWRTVRATSALTDLTHCSPQNCTCGEQHGIGRRQLIAAAFGHEKGHQGNDIRPTQHPKALAGRSREQGPKSRAP